MKTLAELCSSNEMQAQAQAQFFALAFRYFANVNFDKVGDFTILAVVPFAKPHDVDVEFITINEKLLEEKTRDDNSLVLSTARCMTVLQIIDTLPDRPLQYIRFYALEELSPGTCCTVIGTYVLMSFDQRIAEYGVGHVNKWKNYELVLRRSATVKYRVKDYFDSKSYRKEFKNGQVLEGDVFVRSVFAQHYSIVKPLAVIRRKVNTPRYIAKPVWREGQWHRYSGTKLVPVL